MKNSRYDFRGLLDSNNQIDQEYNVTGISVSLLIPEIERIKMKVSGPFKGQAAIENMVFADLIVN